MKPVLPEPTTVVTLPFVTANSFQASQVKSLKFVVSCRFETFPRTRFSQPVTKTIAIIPVNIATIPRPSFN